MALLGGAGLLLLNRSRYAGLPKAHEALGLDGAEYARGYLQHWLRTEEIPEQSAQRIITTAHRIIAAGNQDAGSADAPSA